MRRAAGCLILCAMLALSACGSGGPKQPTSRSTGPPTRPSLPPPEGAPAGERFGANVNRLFDDQRYSPRQIDSELHSLALTGASIARSDTLWDATETAPPVAGRHRYDWRFDDQVASSLASNHLRWLALLDYTPAWEQSLPGVEHSAPRNLADFAAFSGAFAARYGHSGSFWKEHPTLPAIPVDTYEVWNEPDSAAFWKPAPDPGAYGALYTQSRDAIRAMDPAARVIVGGLSKPVNFLQALLSAAPEVRGALDGVAIHPYGRTPAKVIQGVRRSRLTLRGLGLGSVPLYVTEFGWVTSPRSDRHWAPAALRPSFLQQTVAALGHSNCGIEGVIVYTWTTPNQNPANGEDWFGIHPLGSGTSADTDGFSAGLKLASKSVPPLRIC